MSDFFMEHVIVPLVAVCLVATLVMCGFLVHAQLFRQECGL